MTRATDSSTQPPLPTQSSLRRLIDLILRDDALLESFCSDRYFEIKMQFSQGMLRDAKVTILLERVRHNDLLDSLREHDPIEFARHEHVLLLRPGSTASKPYSSGAPEPTPSYVDEWTRIRGEELNGLYESLESCLERGDDPHPIQELILEKKREMRRGPELEPGYTLGNRFKLLERVGQGGFATVWRAFDRRDKIQVAVKVLHPQWGREPSRRDRFYRGAKRMHDLQHEGIVRVLETASEDDGFHYFIMRYVEGIDLQRAVTEAKIDTTTALGVIAQIGSALQHAHEHGLVHRDVKPANILLDEKGKARLTDFDLVWADNTTGGSTGGLGTLLYASEEIRSGASEVTASADVYSLAMTTLFVLRNGDLPGYVFHSPNRAINSLRCSDAVKQVLRRGLAREQAVRYKSVSEFCTDLAASLEPDASPPPPLLVLLGMDRDNDLTTELLTHLQWLQKQRLVRIWYKGLTPDGMETRRQAEAQLDLADIVLLLISADFLATDFFYEEVEALLERQKHGEVVVIPILLRECMVGSTALASINSLPGDHRPIATLQNRDAAWRDVVEGLLTVISARSKQLGAPAKETRKNDLRVQRRHFQTKRRDNVAVEPVRILLVYAEADALLAQELMRYKAPLLHSGLITCSHADMHKLESRSARQTQLREKLIAAECVFLLLSADFLADEDLGELVADDFIEQLEQRLLIYPIIVRPFRLLALTRLKRHLRFMNDARPITLQTNRARAWTSIVSDLMNLIESSRVVVPQASRLVLVYTQEDIAFAMALEAQLKLPRKKGILTIERAMVGEWGDTSRTENADVVVWLVSSDLGATGELNHERFQNAFRRYSDGNLKMLAVRTRWCFYPAQLASIPVFPADDRFMEDLEDPDVIWEEVVTAILSSLPKGT